MLERLGESELGHSFVDCVTDEDAPHYTSFVPFPMSIAMIRDRLSSNFYRQPEAVIDDIRRLHDCAILYNECKAVVSVDAFVVADRGKRAVRR